MRVRIHRRCFIFIFLVFFLVGFRFFFPRSRTTQHVRASDKKSGRPQNGRISAVSGGKKVPKKTKKGEKYTWYFFSRPRHHSCLMPDSPRPSRRPSDRILPPFPTFLSSAAPNPRVLHAKNTFILEKNLKKNIIIFPKYS